MLGIPISEGWMIVLARVVVTGINLLDRGNGVSVEHIILTLPNRVQPRITDRVVWAIRTLYGQVARVRACLTLRDFQNQFSF